MAFEHYVILVLEFNSIGKMTHLRKDSSFNDLVSFACESWDCLTPTIVSFSYVLLGDDSVRVEITSDFKMQPMFEIVDRKSWTY